MDDEKFKSLAWAVVSAFAIAGLVAVSAFHKDWSEGGIVGGIVGLGMRGVGLLTYALGKGGKT